MTNLIDIPNWREEEERQEAIKIWDKYRADMGELAYRKSPEEHQMAKEFDILEMLNNRGLYTETEYKDRVAELHQRLGTVIFNRKYG